LSTIGYGDIKPISVNDKLFGAFILLIGVTFFSIIMNNLMNLINDQKSINNQGCNNDLSKWIALLTRFNGGSPLSKDIINKIEDFFEFYWD